MRLAPLAATVLTLLTAGCGGDETSTSPPQGGVPVVASELSGLSRSLHQPVYWAGQQEGGKLELTRSGAEGIYVRYPSGLTVGTHRVPHALAAVTSAGRAANARTYELPRGGRAAVRGDTPNNVYMAYPGRPYQVEVYNPSPGHALKLVREGRVRPVPTRR